MNHQLLKEYIDLYKSEQVFNRVTKQEYYKWQAFNCFNNHWDIDAENFVGMLEKSFRLSANLLGSHNYFPLRMLLENAQKSQEEIRDLFKDLLSDNIGLVEKVQVFRKNFKLINTENFYGKLDYQDDRAISVYLAMLLPEEHFLYKYGMFKDASSKLEYPYIPKAGDESNLPIYMNFCTVIKHQLIQDKELLRKYAVRLSENTSITYDAHLNLLTQDFIYAINRHISLSKTKETIIPQVSITHINIETIQLEVRNTLLNARTSKDYTKQNKKNIQIGLEGELFILEVEKGKLKSANLNKTPMHTSVELGDGLGFDIKSYDSNGNVKYIEVKTTTGDYSTPFYITINELIASEQYRSNYFLYRVFNYDKVNKTGDILIWQGSLKSLCSNPEVFKTTITGLNK